MRLITALVVLLVSGAAAASDATLTIQNRSDIGIAEVYAQPVHIPDGPGSPLPESAVSAGASVSFAITDASCAYDLVLVTVDGRWYHDTTDLCEVDTYTFEPVPTGWIDPLR